MSNARDPEKIHFAAVLIGDERDLTTVARADEMANHLGGDLEFVTVQSRTVWETRPVFPIGFSATSALGESLERMREKPREQALQYAAELEESIVTPVTGTKVLETPGRMELKRYLEQRLEEGALQLAVLPGKGEDGAVPALTVQILSSVDCPALVATGNRSLRQNRPLRVLVADELDGLDVEPLRFAMDLEEKTHVEIRHIHVENLADERFEAGLFQVYATALGLPAEDYRPRDVIGVMRENLLTALKCHRNGLLGHRPTAEESARGPSYEAGLLEGSDPARKLSEFAANWPCDLLVAGKGHSLRGWTIGETAMGLLRHSPCSVLMVPERR